MPDIPKFVKKQGRTDIYQYRGKDILIRSLGRGHRTVSAGPKKIDTGKIDKMTAIEKGMRFVDKLVKK
jgi:hypothetical protein